MLRGLIAVALCLFACWRGAAAEPPARTPEQLAARIDARLEQSFQAGDLTPAPAAPDAAFFRRVYLDRGGRMPSVAEARAFLEDRAPDRHEKLVEALLKGPGYAAHAAQTWRAFLVPQASANLQTQYLGVS